MENNIKLFEQKKVRIHWDERQEKWYFSVINVIEILTGSTIPKRYWSDLKKKLAKEGSEAYEKIIRSFKCSKIKVQQGRIQLSDFRGQLKM